MGTRCPLHLISFLSHGVLSPGRQSGAGIGWKREALAVSALRNMLCLVAWHERRRRSTWPGVLWEPLRLIKSPRAFEHVKLQLPVKSNSEVDKYWQLRSGNGAITRGESYPSAGHPQHSHRCWLLMSPAVFVVFLQLDLQIHQGGCCFFSAFASGKLTLFPGEKKKTLACDFQRSLWHLIELFLEFQCQGHFLFRQPALVGATPASLACAGASKASVVCSLDFWREIYD